MEIARAGDPDVSPSGDRACLTAHMKSSDHRESRERIYRGLKPAIELEGLEQMYTDEVAAV